MLTCMTCPSIANFCTALLPVNQTEQMILAGSELEGAVTGRLAWQIGLGAREAHLAIDQVAVRQRVDRSAFADWSHQTFDIRQVVVAVPI
jgi:hypothetical protein